MSDDSSDEEQCARSCQICNAVNNRDHQYSDVHHHNLLLWNLMKYRKPLSKDTNGITITASTNYRLPSTGQILNIKPPNRRGQFISTIFEDDLSPTIGITYSFKMVTKKAVFLMKCELLRDKQYFQLNDENNLYVRQYTPNSSGIFPVTLRTDVASIYRTLINFHFQTIDNKNAFNIVKEVVVNIVTDLENPTYGENPFTSKEWVHTAIVDSLSRPYLSNAYSIPIEFTQLFDMAKECFAQHHQRNSDLMTRVKNSIDTGTPTKSNYKEFFKNLLWADEMGARNKIKRYNMEKVPVKLQGKKVILQVIGLAEKRPSLISGDLVLMHFPDTSIVYRGVIQNVLDKEIEIKDFNPQFLNFLGNSGVIVNVEFEIGRLTYVRMHKALDIVDENLLQRLFPDRNVPSNLSNRIYAPVNNIYNPLIRRNKQQLIAIENILKKSFNNRNNQAPYIVFGPPGTGKTITIIEAVRQIFRHSSNSKVLICAPTNMACDNIAEKLVDYFTTNEMLRYIAVERQLENMSDRVKQYTNKTKISVNEFNQYKIIVCTLIKIGSFTNKYTATNVFIDEAGQALEPEALVAISGILSKNGLLVLSGDPKQLEPMCNFALAEKKGLSKSLIRRLLDMPVYQLNLPDSHLFITKLLLNYRNHPDILKLPNELFYEGELQPVSQYPLNDFINKIFIPVTSVKRNNFENKAIEFCGVSGDDERRGKSPSYFNKDEIDMVVKYVKYLIGPECNNIPPEDIGVITPYKRQCIMIQNKIKDKLNIETVDVGSTEAFQGKEKRIIIISTVRAKSDLLLHDKKYNIGFVNNEKLRRPIRRHITEEQKEALLTFMERNGDISSCTFSMSQGRQKKTILLEALTAELNNIPNGICRSPRAWLRCWTDNKSKAKSKAAAMMRHMRGTGGGPPTDIPPLTPWEERIVGLMSVESISGLNVMEVGLAHDSPTTTLGTPSEVDLLEAGSSSVGSEDVCFQEPLHLPLFDHAYTRREAEVITEPMNIRGTPERDDQYSNRRESSSTIVNEEHTVRRKRLRRRIQQGTTQQDGMDQVLKNFVDAEVESNRGRQLLADKIMSGQQAVAASVEAGLAKIADSLAIGLKAISASQQQLAESNFALVKLILDSKNKKK